jgi:hypothetical protein
MKKLLVRIAGDIILKDATERMRIVSSSLDMPQLREIKTEKYEKETPLTQFAVRQAEKFLQQNSEEKAK